MPATRKSDLSPETQKQDPNPDDPFAFATSVNTWLNDVVANAEALKESVGTPNLALDVHALETVIQIERLANQGLRLFVRQLPDGS